jgi:hypothetical protein
VHCIEWIRIIACKRIHSSSWYWISRCPHAGQLLSKSKARHNPLSRPALQSTYLYQSITEDVVPLNVWQMVLIARRNRRTWYNCPFDLSDTAPLNKQRTFTTDLRISRKRRNYNKEHKVKSNCTWVIGYTEWQWPSWTSQGKGTYMNDCVYMTVSCAL